MRLAGVREDIPLMVRLGFGVIRAVGRYQMPDVAYALIHRKDLFGEPFSRWLQRLMRGPSEWRVAERELFASFTATRLFCVF
ncbi:MAG: hypothetical protein AAFV53_35970 [Myxococcota bacterium]